MKNKPIRLKMVLLYLTMTVFTIPLLIISYIALNQLNTAGIAGTAQGDALVRAFIIGSPIYLFVYVLATLFVGRKLAKMIAFPARHLGEAARQIALGDIDVSIDYQSEDELGVLADALRDVAASFHAQSDILYAIAEGDYTGSVEVRSEKDVVNRAIRRILSNNNALVTEIRKAAQQVESGATQVASGAQALASGTTEQAATIEEFSAAISQVQEQAQASNEHAALAYEETLQAGQLMQQSMESINRMTAAMQTISESSNSIAKVIKVIDDIAFQTNILALNAAVEAARAGQHGKGFAVVADEVRNLASKSAEAAKETASMIQNSVQSVEIGNEVAEEAAAGMDKVTHIAASNAEKIQKLNTASQQQKTAIGEILQGITQISEVVQANSATSEQSAASAEEMNAQAAMLAEIVSRFKLREKQAQA